MRLVDPASAIRACSTIVSISSSALIRLDTPDTVGPDLHGVLVSRRPPCDASVADWFSSSMRQHLPSSLKRLLSSLAHGPDLVGSSHVPRSQSTSNADELNLEGIHGPGDCSVRDSRGTRRSRAGFRGLR